MVVGVTLTLILLALVARFLAAPAMTREKGRLQLIVAWSLRTASLGIVVVAMGGWPLLWLLGVLICIAVLASVVAYRTEWWPLWAFYDLGAFLVLAMISMPALPLGELLVIGAAVASGGLVADWTFYAAPRGLAYGVLALLLLVMGVVTLLRPVYMGQVRDILATHIDPMFAEDDSRDDSTGIETSLFMPLELSVVDGKRFIVSEDNNGSTV